MKLVLGTCLTLFLGGQGQGDQEGNPQCRCLFAGSEDTRAAALQSLQTGGAKSCTWTEMQWLPDSVSVRDTQDSLDMTCMLARVPVNSVNRWALYPEQYGGFCEQHNEVGNPGCFHMEITQSGDDVGKDAGGVRLTGFDGGDEDSNREAILAAIVVPTAAGRTKMPLPVATKAVNADGTVNDQGDTELQQLAEPADELTDDDVTAYNSANPGLPAEQNLAKVWCGNDFCYVDKCACTASFFESDYFPQQLVYSYATCGSAQDYTGNTNDANTEDCGNSQTTSATVRNFVGAGVLIFMLFTFLV